METLLLLFVGITGTVSLLIWLVYRFYSLNVPLAGPEFAPQEEILVHRNSSGEYLLHFQESIPKEGLTITYDHSSAPHAGEGQQLSAVFPETQTPPLDRSKRFFFTIQEQNKPSRIFSERRIALNGAGNFRDLGGYMTQDGQMVRWGKIFRSDKLSSLNQEDYHYLNALQIHSVFDFRGPEEVKAHPTKYPEFFQPEKVPLPIYDPRRTMKQLLRLLRKAKPGEFSGEAYMVDGYQLFTREFIGQYKALFQMLLKGDPGALVYHCTGGKDRTGLASALILEILGVPKEMIYMDYLSSNYYRFKENKRHIRLGKLYGINPVVLIPILEVRKIYLDTSYRVILEQYGTMTDFFREALGLGKPEIEQLKVTYLYKK